MHDMNKDIELSKYRFSLALESIDFKRHKDVVAYFNKEFVATGKFPGEMGRRLARLKMKREESDYNDFFIASADEAKAQLESVEYILPLIREYLEACNPKINKYSDL